MTSRQQGLSAAERRDLKVLARFTAVYCRARHEGGNERLEEVSAGLPPLGLDHLRFCGDCRELLLYAMQRRLKCPLDPKPTCKHCPIHCYRPGHREKVREIMRFSGRYLLRRGRLDLLWHYFF